MTTPLSHCAAELPQGAAAHRIRDDAEALAVARAVAAEFETGASARDRDRHLPWAELERFSSSGLGGITVPRALGGADVSHLTLARVFAILSAADPSLGQIPQNHFGFLNLLRLTGTAEQQARYFGGVLEGKRAGNAGPERDTKHAGDVSTRVVADGDAYTVTGRKFYSTGALYAHWVPAKALDEAGQLVTVVLDRASPGLTVIDDWSSFGQRTTASGTVILDGVRVRAEDILPAWQATGLPSLQGAVAQLMQAAIDLGIAQGAVRDTVEFLRTRARPWIEAKVERATEDPYVIADMGRLYTELHAAEAVLERAAALLDELAAHPLDAAVVAQASIAVAKAKVLTTGVALDASEKLFELSGSRASLAEFNLDRHWRNARVHTLHDPVRWKHHAIGNHLLNGVFPKRRGWL